MRKLTDPAGFVHWVDIADGAGSDNLAHLLPKNERPAVIDHLLRAMRVPEGEWEGFKWAAA